MFVFLFLGCLSICFSHFDCHLGGVPAEIHRLNFFDTDLLRYAAEDKVGNVVVSPASVKAVLAMVLEGAQGNTSNEIRSALRLSPIKNEFREQLNLYLSALNANTSQTVLQNTNAVFVSNKINLKKDYETMLRKIYYADIFGINVNDPLSTSENINRWVNDRTKGLISHIIEPSNIAPALDMMITNAVYFKSSWHHAFNPRYTRPSCFRVNGVCRKVSMMEMHKEFNYAFVDPLRAHALELPYEGGRYSMLLLVPYEYDGVVSLIRDLPYMSLPQISKLMELTDVRLIMPKFSIDYSESMVGPLRSMRITTLFTKEANLTGMYDGGSAQINDILHKVHLTVDEVGTVAAAASTAAVIPLIEDGVQMHLDRPFLFFIRDNELGLVLFEGKIGEPTEYVEPVLPDPARNSANSWKPAWS